MDFVHLHNHTHYSLQDAACTVDSLVNAAVKHEMKALALTDHGVMYGAAEFYKKAKKAGIKPIIGMEAYIVVDGSRKDRGSGEGGRKKSRNYNHLVLLAKNNVGYKNLAKLSSIGHYEGFYYKPRIDMEVLEQYKEGLICTSACASGVVSVHLVNGDYEKAREVSIQFKEMFGDDFYLEIQDHGLEYDKFILEGMPKLSAELGIKMVATNDIHYIEHEHAIAHNILLLLSDKSGQDYKKLRYTTDQVFFKSTEEMVELFKDYDGAITNTVEIAEKVEDDIRFGGLHFPKFPIPENSPAKTLDDYFELLAKEGLQKRYADREITKEVQDRFDMEIGVIRNMGYSGYFLITQDFINAAKDQGIPVGPGRGSAAGSLVAYALGITNVNPLDYDLLFERFLNPARQSMPDIDIDFADDQRGDVIEYVKQKYGEDSVCQIVTFNTLSSKAVLRDVARVLKIPIPTVNEITKHIPSLFGKVFSIEKALNEVAELQPVRDSDDPVIQDLIKYGKVLEGMNRNASKHAAGVVIAPGPVSDYVALARAGNDGDLVSQFNMKELEGSAGLLKMDFLGLRTLTIIRDTITLIKKHRNIDVDIDSIPLDDPKTYELFAKGQTTAIFQFESGAMREYLKNLKPNSIKDLAAMNALYRPGPMDQIPDFIDRKFGRKTVQYTHNVLEPILNETYGIIVYQEQVIQIANKVAGMSLADADLLRRAMGKKDAAAMAKQREIFISGAVEKGIPQNDAKQIFDDIEKFASYGFNKSHAVAYSLVAYQTAYLKANYLAEFLAANLSNEFGNADKVTTLLDDCRKLKVKVLPPNVNSPSTKFNVEDGNIIFGMSAIKNVGVNAVEGLKESVEKLGRKFTTIYDLCMNVDTRIVNKRVLEGLVLAGAMDELTGYRSQNFEAIEHALDFGTKAKSAIEMQANSLFGESSEEFKIEEPVLPDVEPWDDKNKLSKEREVLGFYLSDHPLRKYEVEYNSFATVRLGEPETFTQDDNVRACGVITDVKTKIDKAGRKMAFVKIDDFTGSCECLMFSKIYEEFGDCIEKDNPVLLRAKPESSGDSLKLHIEEAYPISEAKFNLTKNLILYLDNKKHTNETLEHLNGVFQKNSGDVSLYMCVLNNGSGMEKFVLPDLKVKITDEFVERISEILGESSFRYAT